MRLLHPFRRAARKSTAAAAATATLAALLAVAPAPAGAAGEVPALPTLSDAVSGDDQATQDAAEEALGAVQDALEGPVDAADPGPGKGPPGSSPCCCVTSTSSRTSWPAPTSGWPPACSRVR